MNRISDLKTLPMPATMRWFKSASAIASPSCARIRRSDLGLIEGRRQQVRAERLQLLVT